MLHGQQTWPVRLADGFEPMGKSGWRSPPPVRKIKAESRSMGVTHVTTRIRSLTGTGPSYQAEFLVDTGAIDCLAPASQLRKVGIKPEGKAVYELADGRPVEMQYGFARVSFIGAETVAQVIFGPENAEPILGVVALENTGITVDPATRTLSRLHAKPLKGKRRPPSLRACRRLVDTPRAGPDTPAMFGSHLSIAGGMHHAILEARELGMDTVQVFTKNQQQWVAKPLAAGAVREWKDHLAQARFTQTVSHASYLINLASPEDALWRRSIGLFAEEIRRCRRLGIPWLVIHPGSHMGSGEAAGLARVAQGLDRAYATSRVGGGVVTCLEITAGQGTSLGHRLEHLAEIIERSRQPERLAVCLDTAHLFAAGYDFRGRGYARLMRQIQRTVGRQRVRVLHLNDSKKDLGSRVDRHEHIGRGKIGLEGFRPWVRDRAFAQVPKILETPKEGRAPDGRAWDAVNLDLLRGLGR
jgi:deoxyribonuclease-4